MSSKIFKNKFLLNFQSPLLEEKYKNHLHQVLIKYNPWFALLGLIFSIADAIFESLVCKDAMAKGFDYIKITKMISYSVPGLFFLQTLFSFIIKNFYLQKVVGY
jgi:hypothetical protein